MNKLFKALCICFLAYPGKCLTRVLLYHDRPCLSELSRPWFLPVYATHPQTHVKGLDLSAKGKSNVLEAPDLIHATQMPWVETSESTITNNHPCSAPTEHRPARPAACTMDGKPWTINQTGNNMWGKPLRSDLLSMLEPPAPMYSHGTSRQHKIMTHSGGRPVERKKKGSCNSLHCIWVVLLFF